MSRNMEHMRGNGVARPTGAQAIDRAACLLRQVVDAPDPVTFTELTTSSGLAKSTTSRILLALERNGLVRREPSGAFKPGDAFIRYALHANTESDLVAIARPYLDRLGVRYPGDDQSRSGPRPDGRTDRPSRQPLRARRHQLARPFRTLALHGARQGAPRLRSSRAPTPAPFALLPRRTITRAIRARGRSMRGPSPGLGPYPRGARDRARRRRRACSLRRARR